MLRAVLIFLATAFSACSVPVVQDLPEGEANRVMEELAREKIPVRKTRTDPRKGLYGVEVPRESIARAISVISSRDALPPRREGLSAFVRPESSLAPSGADRQIRYFAAVAAELERTLETLSGVQRARVHLALAPSGDVPFSLQPAPGNPTRASVLLRVREREFDLQPEEVQALVAGAVPGLSRSDVAVVVQPVAANPLPAQDLLWIGPLLVSAGTAWTLGIFLAAWLGLTVFLLYMVVSRKRRSREPVPDAQTGAPDAPPAGPPGTR